MYSTSLFGKTMKILKIYFKTLRHFMNFSSFTPIYMMMKNVKIDIYVQHVICFVYEIVLKGKNKNAFLLSFCTFLTFLYPTQALSMICLSYYMKEKKKRKTLCRVLGIRNVQASKRRSSKNFWETEKFLVSCLKMKWNCLYVINIH